MVTLLQWNPPSPGDLVILFYFTRETKCALPPNKNMLNTTILYVSKQANAEVGDIHSTAKALPIHFA